MKFVHKYTKNNNRIYTVTYIY